MEHVNYPGQAASLLGLASYSLTCYKGCGLAQGWFPDNNTKAAANNTGLYTRQDYLNRNPDPKGSFQCVIPMRHIFGFVDDYSNVTYGMRDTLQLIRKDDDDALFSVPQTTSTVWRLGVSSAPENPRWVLIGLQTNKSGNQERTAAIFDHCNLTNMQV